MVSPRSLGLVSLALSLASLPATAQASDPPPDRPPAAFDAPPKCRCGLLLGGSIGAGLMGASGYPNNATVLHNPAYYSSSDLMVGSSQEFFLGGAMSDYLSFGGWFGWGNYESTDWRSTGYGVGLRVEAFPLFAVSPALRNLGVFGHFGLGGVTLATKREGNYPTADGTQSFLGAGVFYEFSLLKLLGGHFAGGPSLQYDAIYSQSAERHGAVLGLRLAFYGGK